MTLIEDKNQRHLRHLRPPFSAPVEKSQILLVIRLITV
jgi:hypothetical protein